LSKDDRSFLAGFHERRFDRFSHRDHLRLAWIVMSKHGLSDGLNLMRQGIKGFAEDQGSGNRYHETNPNTVLEPTSSARGRKFA
jgi:hypothetical protein